MTSKLGDPSLGWVAADGVVVTRAAATDEVGRSAEFTRIGTARTYDCWVAERPPALQISVLRCDGLVGPRFELSDAFPSPGNNVVALYLERDGTLQLAPTTVVANDVKFMGESRVRFGLSVVTPTSPTAPPGAIAARTIVGAPVMNEDGTIVSTVLAAPRNGGQPIGTNVADVRRQIRSAETLPPSFAAAAMYTIGRHALIPVLVGLVVGVLWTIASRGHRGLAKILGLPAVGLLLTAAYAVLGALAIGPETLVG